MNCPKCHSKTKVIDSRINPANVRRRRQCMNDACQYRYSTYEQAEDGEFKPTYPQLMRLREVRKMIDDAMDEVEKSQQ